jgi:hypothetical protein
MENDFTFGIMRSKVWEVVSWLGGFVEDHMNISRQFLFCRDIRRAQDCQSDKRKILERIPAQCVAGSIENLPRGLIGRYGACNMVNRMTYGRTSR